MKEQDYWDNIHSSYTSNYDGWLDKYLYLFDKDYKILELGAGRAYNSLFLIEEGYKNTIISDFSKEVLEILKNENKNIKLLELDIRDKYPFKNNSIDIIIADLSLHYFNDEDMKKIISEIKRVLKQGGLLIGRVNSINDDFHKPEEKYKINEKLFFDNIMYKRFFSKEDIVCMFNEFEIITNEEKNMERYEKPKVIIEFCIRKK